MAVFSSLLIGMTILFGISTQMLLLDININYLKGTQGRLFLICNLLVLLLNMVIPLILPVDLYMKFYVLVVHLPIFFIFLFTTQTSAVKIMFALFTAVFLIYPANAVLTIISKVANKCRTSAVFITVQPRTFCHLPP